MTETPDWAFQLVRPPVPRERPVRRRPAVRPAATPLVRHMQAAQQALASAIRQDRPAPGPALCPCAFPHPAVRDDLAANVERLRQAGSPDLHHQLVLLARVDGCPSLR
ncbi:hypothetical protein AB0K51_09505 [Kitasatospora sp. NPDC049285]|uniref:hypothetical protein n=1 Tax=Kitasatospora sp. NPDC049285 TaxID=3157096 RepID=UPI003442EA10